MKILLALFFCMFCATATRAQEPAAVTDSAVPPGMTVTKLKWSREYQQPLYNRSRDYAPTASVSDWFPSLESPPFSNTRRDPTYNPFPPSGRLSYVYVYSAKVENNSQQAISSLSWDYVFVDPASKEELSRHHFYSREKIGKKSETTLRGRSAAPPSNVVSVAGLEKDKRSPYDERVEFRCVFYVDGTTWRSPSVTETECFYLKNRPKVRRRPRM